MNNKSPKAPRTPLKTNLQSLLITVVLGAVYYYVALPPLNPKSYDLYAFIIVLCAIFLLARAILSPPKEGRQQERRGSSEPLFEQDGNGVIHINRGFSVHRQSGVITHGIRDIMSAPVVIIALCMAVGLVGSLISMPIFHAKAYYNLLQVETGDFTEDVAQISYNEIPMLDEDSAIQLGKRALGNISTNSNLVSQFEVSDNYSQINYNQQPVRVSPLEYGDIIKWFNNRSEGLPGYIVVNMVSQEAELVQLEEGIRYSDCEHFNRNLYRHLRFNYPTFMFGDMNFETDDDGNPWWVCSREVRTIGLFGGVDVKGTVLVNAVTGECEYYEEVPSWVDRVYSASTIITQYNYRGALVNGWLNSWLGQKGVTTTTEGYNYIALNDDVYMYTGVTSAGSDESNVGFILVNQRTKEAKYYNITGAEEYSAMSSAEGAVQHLNYSATFPILLNISDQPTYFMALKDSAALVKMYAMVNVSDYQVTATGSTVAECQANYEELLLENGINVEDPVEEVVADTATVSGTIEEIRSAVISGNTYYYLRLADGDSYYAISAAQAEEAVILNEGDRVTITYELPEDGESTSILSATELSVE
ncbi:MAG: CvpA family protein [Clostridiales bacterium]|nr:CvpA family protein [Clostridiales bacterium]